MHTTTATMRAITQDRFGPPEVLALRTAPRPTPGPGQALVRVHAAGVDRGVWHLVAGLPYPVRLAGFGLRVPTKPVPGLDLAGVVESVGEGVTAFAPGDEVLGIGVGTYAEYALAPVAKLVAKPAAMTFEQAAATAISGLTALQAVRDHAKVEPGQNVLVIGASGGVGSFAVQVAKAYGAQVTGVCHGSKADLVRALGADHVVDHTREDATAQGHRYDAVIDIGGNTTLRKLRRALTPTGTLVIVGGESGGRWLGGMDRQLRGLAIKPFIRQRMRVFVSSEDGADIAELARLFEAGKVTAAVGRVYPLEQAPLALRHLEDGKVRGKAVISLL